MEKQLKDELITLRDGIENGMEKKDMVWDLNIIIRGL